MTVLTVLLASPAAAAEPARAISAADALGCCLCRGTPGGDQNALRSCSDGKNADSCASTCKAQGADSLIFGQQQRCLQGCAGYPTQNLK